MTIAILHLSDIHLASPTDAVTGRIKNISTAIVPNLRDATSLVVLVSGDIAQAGLSEEYSIAEGFLSELIGEICKQSDVSISVVMAPGNHDCDFSGDQDVRHAIIEAVKKKGVPIPEGYISTSVKVQENFFSFRERNETGTSARLNGPLWKSHLLEVEGKRIIFDMLNASWMSTRHEQQGGLIFPFEQFSSQTPSDADLRIVTMHHPLNWYNQSNYLKFRGFIHHLADLVVTGHEHQSSGRTADDAVDGECAYIEGAALQMRDDHLSSGFNFIEIDLTNDRFQYTPYCLKEGHYSPSSTLTEWRHYRALPKRQASELSITESFRATLLDPGATLKHPSGIALTLEDIYVFPDLDTRIDKRSDNVRRKSISKPSSKHLTDLPSLKKNVLIGGTEVAGKTCLLHRLFDIYHSHGFFPLFLRGKDLKRSVSSDIEKYLTNAIDAQYGSHVRERFRQLGKDKKVLLLIFS